MTVRAEALHAVRKRLVASDFRARLRMPGMDESRADIIVAGAVVLDTILERLGVSELMLCEWSLREGILLDYIHAHPRSLARAEAYPDVRRRSVIDLAERCLYDEPHARHVAALALPSSTRPGACTAWATPSARCSSTPRCSTTSATTSPIPATTSTPTT